MRIDPVDFTWDEKNLTMRAHPRFARVCRRQFVDGESYRMETHEQRSTKQHARYFAAIREAHNNLDDEHTARYPTPEHLRHWALIRCRYFNHRAIPCESMRQAERLVLLAKELDPFCVAVPKGDVVDVYTAKSQSRRAMNKDEFKKSSDEVLDLLATIIRVKKSDLQKQADHVMEE